MTVQFILAVDEAKKIIKDKADLVCRQCKREYKTREPYCVDCTLIFKAMENYIASTGVDVRLVPVSTLYEWGNETDNAMEEVANCIGNLRNAQNTLLDSARDLLIKEDTDCCISYDHKNDLERGIRMVQSEVIKGTGDKIAYNRLENLSADISAIAS